MYILWTYYDFNDFYTLTYIIGTLLSDLCISLFQTGLTALHVAAQYGQMEFVREMLSKVPATVRSEPPHKSDGPLREVEVGTNNL